ncbi:hypothetical protein [Pedobacter immunditicola]|uniref:hypothetical protein n=1 Tax=Pedobacter immunditicola TaxID=3133440 RepID=UPI0030AABF92
MKKLTLLLLLLLPFVGYSQTEIPKNSDKIIVINKLTAADNFIKAKQALADLDIEILSQDRDIFQIKTGKIRSTDNGSYAYLINCREGKISITGTWGTNLGLNVGMISQGPSNYAIKYKGLQKFIFNKMNDFALKLGDKLEYQTSEVIAQTRPKGNDDLYN